MTADNSAAYAGIARNLMRLCIGFDPTQDQAGHAPASAASLETIITHGTRAYLGAHEREWLFMRPIALELLGQLSGGAIMLHGERGTGKSSLLRSIDQLREPTLFDGHIVVIDLNQIEARVNTTPLAMREPYIRRHIFSQLRTQILDRAYDPTTEAILHWTLVGEHPAFERFLAFLELRGQRPGFTSPAELASLLRLDSQVRTVFDECRKRYFDDTSVWDRDMDRLQAFARTAAASSTILAFDNVDRLDPVSQVDVASIARSISTATKYQLPIILSCRSENMAQLHELIDTIKVFPIPCSPSPTKFEGGVIGWDVREIFQLRLDLLTSPGLWEYLRDIVSSVEVNAVKEQVDILQRRVQEALDLIWVEKMFTPSDSDESLIELVTTLTEWHNGSIRTIAFSLFNLIWNMTADPLYMRVESGVAERRLRNLIYRHVLFYPGTPPDWEYHTRDRAGVTLPPSVEMFGATPENVPGNHLPFFFTKYRMLRFLLHKRTRQPLRAVYATFKKYGVDEESVEAALGDLSGDTGGYPLVRIERLRSIHSSGRDRHVEALPAGSLLAKTLCFTCEYMYWSAITNRSMDGAIQRAIPDFERVRSRPPTEPIKVHVAAIFLLEYLMPRLRQEHPYLKRKPTPSDHVRLRNFRQDFGFDRERWFIDRAVESIRGYAHRAEVKLPPPIEDQLSAVVAEASRLTRMLDVRP